MAVVTNKLDKLLATLNTSGIQQENNALYQVISELIKQLKIVALAVGSSGGDTNIVQQIIQQFINQSDGGEGDSLIIPGPAGIRGADGATGATGAQGPPFPAFIYLDAEDPEQLLPIPGNTGAQGIQGPAGVSGGGGNTIILEDQYEENLIQLNDKNNGWILLATQVIVAGTAAYDFTNLGPYSEILAVANDIVRSTAVTSALQVSTDNGATFSANTADYDSIAGTGIITATAGLGFCSTSVTAARSGSIVIRGFNCNGVPKQASCSRADLPTGLININAPLNAVRVTQSAGTMTSGTIYIWGRL